MPRGPCEDRKVEAKRHVIGMLAFRPRAERIDQHVELRLAIGPDQALRHPSSPVGTGDRTRSVSVAGAASPDTLTLVPDVTGRTAGQAAIPLVGREVDVGLLAGWQSVSVTSAAVAGIARDRASRSLGLATQTLPERLRSACQTLRVPTPRTAPSRTRRALVPAVRCALPPAPRWPRR